MLNEIIAAGVLSILGLSGCWLACWLAWRSWGQPEEGLSTFGDAYAMQIRNTHASQRVPLPVEHVEASETPAPAGAIGTVAAEVSDIMATVLTSREQAIRDVWEEAHHAHDLWLLGAAVDQAFADYETRMLRKRAWSNDMAEPIGSYESTQQRIDRWLVEGEGTRALLAEARRAASETWDAPSGAMPVMASAEHAGRHRDDMLWSQHG